MSHLHEAAARGAVDEVRRLLDEGADPDARAPLPDPTPGRSPAITVAMAACRAGDRAVPILEVLVERGADLRLTTPRGWTTLHAAAASANRPAIEFLHRHGLDVNARTRTGRTPLHDFLDSDPLPSSDPDADRATLGALLDRGATWKVRVPAGTPLHRLARIGHAPCVELLLSDGHPVDPPNDHGRTPLMMVDGAETARVLLEYGADPLRGAFLPFDPLRRLGHPWVSREAEGGYSPDLERIKAARLRKLARRPGESDEEMRARMVDTLPRSFFGASALEYAVVHPSDALRAFLEAGYEPNAVRGIEPLIAAIRSGQVMPTRLLLEAGARLPSAHQIIAPRVPHSWNSAAEGCAILTLLREFGLDLEERDLSGQTVLHHAIAELRPLLVEILIAAGARIDAQFRGRAPLEFLDVALDERIRELGSDRSVFSSHFFGMLLERIATITDDAELRTGFSAERITSIVDAVERELGESATVAHREIHQIIERDHSDLSTLTLHALALEVYSRLRFRLGLPTTSISGVVKAEEDLFERAETTCTLLIEADAPVTADSSRRSPPPTLFSVIDRIGADAMEGEDLAAALEAAALEPSGAVRERDATGDLPIHRVVRGTDALDRRIALMSNLIGRGADLAGRDGWGRTPLQVACSHGSIGMVERLIDAGASIRGEGKDDPDALHVVIPATGGPAVPDLLEKCRLLIDHGAHPRKPYPHVGGLEEHPLATARQRFAVALRAWTEAGEPEEGAEIDALARWRAVVEVLRRRDED